MLRSRIRSLEHALNQNRPISLGHVLRMAVERLLVDDMGTKYDSFNQRTG